MSTFIEFLIIGLSLGAIYGLIAVPVSLVWSTTRTLDVAAGGYAVIGGLAGAAFTQPLGLAVALAVGIFFGAVMGLVYMALQRRPTSDHLSAMLLSIGLLFAIGSLAQMFFGVDPVYEPFTEEVWNVGGLRVRVTSIVNLVVVLVSAGLLMAGLYGTRFGRWTRACASSPKNAALMGIPVKRVQFASFALSGALGALGGVLLVGSRGLSFDFGLPLALLGIGALMVLGMRGPGTAVAGGIVLGIVESMGNGYLPEGIAPIIPLLFILLVLASGRFDIRIGVARP
jgi:branched-subunit amino acid ABC-type transport system permease component